MLPEADVDRRISGFERRNLRLLTIAEASGGAGTQMTAVLVPLILISEYGASAALVSIFAAARYVPFLALGPFIGRVVDEHSPRREMILADATRLACLVAVPLLFAIDRLSVPVLLVLVLVISSARVLYDLATGSYIVRHFQPSSFLHANARLDAVFGLGEAVGPSLAGLLSSAIGAVTAISFDGLSRVISLVALRRVTEAPEGEPRVGGSGARPGVRAAFRVLLSDRVLRMFVGVAVLQNLGLMILQGVALVILVSERGFSPGVAGSILTAMGVGGVAGSMFGVRVVRRVGLRQAAVASALVLLLCPLALLLPASAIGGATCALAYLALGASLSTGSLATRRYRQAVVPAEQFASVSGLYGSLVMGSLPLGATLGGLVSVTLGLDAALVVSSAVFLISAAVTAGSFLSSFGYVDVDV